MALTLDEWREKSRKGEKCFILGCNENPTTKCNICNLHICYNHLSIHFHEVTEKDSKNEEKNIESLK